jgi:hypothetical protein
MNIHHRAVITGLMAMSLAGCSRHRTDDLAREWDFPGGESIRFSHENPGFGSDHAKYLDVRFKDGRTQHYAFAEGHAGYNEVSLYLDASHTKIWLIDDRMERSRVFLDLSTGSFKDESFAPPLASDASPVPARGTSASLR